MGDRVTPDEGKAILDSVAQRLLHLSGDEFLAGWDRGDYRGDDRHEVIEVAMLIPFVG